MNYEELSQILFNQDPARTGCVENEMFDEYDDIALIVCNEVAAGVPLFDSLKQCFDDMFFVGHVNDQDIQKIVNVV